VTHLTPQELTLWRDRPAEADRARIVGHLAVCEPCTSRLAELVRAAAPGAADAPPLAPGDFVQRGYGVMQKRRGQLIVFRPQVLIPLAAAAAILLAVWLPASRRASEPVDGAPVVRGTRPQALTPAGDVSGALEFTWASPVSPDRYGIEIKDAAGQRVFYRETRDARLASDAALEAVLRPGAQYLWTVAALDEAGEVIAVSEPRAFSRAGGTTGPPQRR
jgi:hypothetical protein